MIPDFLSDSSALRWILACFAAAVFAGAAYRIRALDPTGTAAAFFLGTALVGSAGWWCGVILIAFFISASLLSRVGGAVPTISTSRGSRRDAVQVLANGGVALICALTFGITGQHMWLLALAGSLAAASADTWSTEVGRTSTALPRLITTGRAVPAGTSGAVSRRGLVAAASGGLFIGALAAVGARIELFHVPVDWKVLLLAVGIGGVIGALFDSLLGATLQEQRWCERCQKRTEQRVHRCGSVTQRLSGVPWITNDVVNTACVLAGALVSAAIGSMLS